jgi:hypothetical protein
MGVTENRSKQDSNDRLEGVIRATIKDLEKRRDKAIVRTDTDNLWTKIESLHGFCLSYLP